MSKKTRTRSRAVKRKQERKQARRNQLFIYGLVGLGVVMVVVALIAPSSGALSGPEVAQDRLELDPVLGNPDAPVTIIEYGAYSCHACQSWHESGIIDQILREYPNQVNFIYRDFPVISPAYDRRAAQVAQCALDQGTEQFWTFHDALFDRYNIRDSSSRLVQLGEDVGLDGEALRTCVDANTHQATVLFDLQRANELGLSGTPTFVINGSRLYGATPDSLRNAVNQALAESS